MNRGTLHNQMPMWKLRRRWNRILKLYGERGEAEAHRDQAIADLFYECGWTQEEIAEFLGHSQKQVSRQLAYGRFLNRYPKLREHLTITRFENMLTMFTGIEDMDERFAKMEELFAEIANLPRPSSKVGKALVARYLQDRDWHSLDSIAAAVNYESKAVRAYLLKLLYPYNSSRLRVEERLVDGVRHFRFMPHERTSWRMGRAEWAVELDKWCAAVVLLVKLTKGTEWHDQLMSLLRDMQEARQHL